MSVRRHVCGHAGRGTEHHVEARRPPRVIHQPSSLLSNSDKIGGHVRMIAFEYSIQWPIQDFLDGGGVPTPTSYSAKFSRKLHQNKKSDPTGRGARPRLPQSVNTIRINRFFLKWKCSYFCNNPFRYDM